MSLEIQSTKRKGRKPVAFEWPKGDFTVKDVSATIMVSLSSVAIQNRINDAVASGELIVLENTRKNGGRPAKLYRCANIPAVPINASEPVRGFNPRQALLP